MKFKVGDFLVGKKKANLYYSVTRCGVLVKLVGKAKYSNIRVLVLKLDNLQEHTKGPKEEFDVDSSYFKLYKGGHNGKHKGS